MKTATAKVGDITQNMEIERARFQEKYSKVCITRAAVNEYVPYSGLFSWVQIFVKSSIRPPELNFVVLNFVARWAVI